MKSWKEAKASEHRSFAAISMVFSGQSHLLEEFFDPDRARLCAPPDEILARTADFSSGEGVLVKAALGIWSGSGNAFVWELLEALDEDAFKSVVGGLTMVKQGHATLFGPLQRRRCQGP